MNKKESPDWLRLQRKIFSRWCNQKLSLSRNMPVEDIVDEIGDGIKLINLIEVLSEVDYTEKYNKTPKMKVHKIDNCNRALKFVKQQGVEMKTPPSAENLVDGDELNILGLIWAIMSKYMKFGDDDESLNAKEALLLWVQNKTAGYDDVAVKDFKSSIKDGVAMGAVIHKHRPNMIDMSKLTKGKDNAVANWTVVQDAALKYFDLEKYITPEDILKLDENSMVVYVSEYYTGIAEQRKVDLAARRITKLIRFTEENDKLRAEYVVKAKSFTDTVAKVQVILNDRTIDNTMAGAKAKIEQFYEYKATDKSSILGDQLALEGLFNSLAMRLSHGKRPAYVPPEGTDLDAMNATVGQLEKTEQERKVALHQELNRQIKLLDFDKQHKAASAQLVEYQTTTEADLAKKEVSHSVAAASYQLRHLDALDRERKSIVSTTFAKLLKLGATLKDEKYERSNEVADREQQLTSTFDRLEKLSSEKRPVLDDDLAREIFREDLRLKNEQHVQKHAKIEQWVAEQTAYLEKKEEIDSVGDATLQLGLLSAYASEKEAQSQAAVASFKALGAEVLAAKYDNGLSTYELGDEPDTANKDQLRARETAVDEHWQRLDGLYNDKKAVLEDDLARETFRDNLKLQDNMHRRSHAALTAWASEGASYLAQREDIDDIPKANTQLSILKAWRGDFAAQQSNALPALKTLGKSILEAKYETSLSSYTFGSAQSDTQTPEQLKEREQKIDETFVNLDGAAGEKQSWLEAELAREQAKEENRVQFANQAAAFARLASETDNEAKSTHFGFTLAEVEAFGAELQADDQQREKATDEQHAAAVETFAEGEKLGVKSNAYTEATPASLTTLHEQTKKALADRRERYEKELAHQRYLDGLARDFAALADPFSESMVSTKNQISSSQNSLEEQLAFVAARVAESEAGDQPKLEAILAAQKKLDDEGVTNNIHTTLTGKDVETQHQQFVLFLNAKKKMLEEAIEQAKLRGLTESDFKEIKENFEQFDKDGDKSISQKELKACLFSLGEEKGPKEVEAIMQEFGENGELSEERFTEFMIKTLGDADTKDEILAGFKLINRGEDQKTTVDRMENVLESHEVEYLKENATPIDDGYDYVAWTEDVYSR